MMNTPVWWFLREKKLLLRGFFWGEMYKTRKPEKSMECLQKVCSLTSGILLLC
jgi:hypothetical protein